MNRTLSPMLTAALALALGTGALAQTARPDKDKPSSHDTAVKAEGADVEFAQKAATGGKHEVAGAKVAAAKGSSAEVKSYASKLVRDHTAANNELMAMMKKKHIPPAAEEKPAAEPWRNETGAAFDRAYIEHAISEHEKDIALFEAESKDGGDAELKAWAGKKLPALREHLKTAQDLKTKLPTTTR
jgi:putative membrane protein